MIKVKLSTINNKLNESLNDEEFPHYKKGLLLRHKDTKIEYSLSANPITKVDNEIHINAYRYYGPDEMPGQITKIVITPKDYKKYERVGPKTQRKKEDS